MIKELFKKYKEIILYIVFGGLTTLVNWVIYSLLVRFCGVGITVSNAVAWIAAVVFAFVTNKIYVFESKNKKAKTVAYEFVSFVSSRAITGVIEIFGVPLLVKVGVDEKIFGIDGAIAKIIVSVIVIILNYVFSKLIVFRKKKQEKTENENIGN